MKEVKNKIFKVFSTKTSLFISCFIVIIGIFLTLLLVSFALPQVIKEVTFSSEKLDYSKKEQGSFNIKKSAKWISQGKAEIRFDIDTIAKTVEGSTCKDVIFVLDTSSSMYGTRLNKVKNDSIEVLKSMMDDSEVALITFNSESQIESNFTKEKSTLVTKIESLNATKNTNYYQALVNVDSLLKDYKKECNVSVIFLTDGSPTEDTPSEVGYYQYLKEKYKNLTINGVQYEAGDKILEALKKSTDYQYLASIENLKQVLYNASGTKSDLNYEEFKLTDFINDKYFEVSDSAKIKVSSGEVTLESNNKITWNLNNMKSGTKQEMTIEADLKPEYKNQSGYFDTNTHETVKTKIGEEIEEIDTPLTPVLKQNSEVIYDGNAPEGCTVTNIPESKEYTVYDKVEISSSVPICEGYQFKGWKIATADVKKINDDYFIMPEYQVDLKAEWAKITVDKSMDGTVYEAKEPVLQEVEDNYNEKIWKYKSSATKIVIENTKHEIPNAIESYDISSIGNGGVMAYVVPNVQDINTFTIYIQATGKIIANRFSSYLFKDFTKVSSIEGLENFDTKDVEIMNYMFCNTGKEASTFSLSGLDNWNTSKVYNMAEMFHYAGSNATSWDIGNISQWDTSKVQTMHRMFKNAGSKATTWVVDLTNWNMKNVDDMKEMFYYSGEKATTWEVKGTNTWNINSDTDLSYMFANAGANSTTFKVDMRGVIDSYSNGGSSNLHYDNMFQNAGANSTTFYVDVSDWNLYGYEYNGPEKVYLNSMFYGAGENVRGSFTVKMDNWKTYLKDEYSYNNYILPVDFYGVFSSSGSEAKTYEVSLTNWKNLKITTLTNAFRYTARGYNTDTYIIKGLDTLDVSEVTSMYQAFHVAGRYANEWNIGDLSSWDTSKVTSMFEMFRDAGRSSFTNIGNLSIPAECDVENFAWDSYRFNGNLIINGSLLNQQQMLRDTSIYDAGETYLYYKNDESKAIVEELIKLYGPSGTISNGQIYNGGLKE